jgi:hypothetical protein
MAVTRSNLLRGPAKVTWNGATFWSREDIEVNFQQTWEDILTSCFDVVDAAETDRQIKINLTLWGAWENMSVLFPSQVVNSTVGGRLYTGSDLPLVIHLRGSGTTQRLTIHNVQITKLADLYLGLDNTLFAQCEFTGLIKDAADPETAASYYTLDTAAYSDVAFSFSNYHRQRWSASWKDDAATPAAISGFSSFQAHKGWNIGWAMKGAFDYNANVGTVDYVIQGLEVTAKCNQIVGPTLSELVAARRFDSRALGKRVGEGRGQLTLTAGPTGPATSIVINKASLVDNSPTFGNSKLLNGDVTWKSYRSTTTAGATQATVVIT